MDNKKEGEVRQDISNGALGKYLSMEFLLALILGGVAWGAITTKVSALNSEVEAHGSAHKAEMGDIQLEQKALSEEVSLVNRKLDVIENNQKHFQETMRSSSRQQYEILRILRQQYPNVTLEVD